MQEDRRGRTMSSLNDERCRNWVFRGAPESTNVSFSGPTRRELRYRGLALVHLRQDSTASHMDIWVPLLIHACHGRDALTQYSTLLLDPCRLRLLRHMQHDLGQYFRLRSQGCVQLREASPLSDQIHRVQRVAAQHAGETGLCPGRQRLPLLRDFPQPAAAGRFFFDERDRRFARVSDRKGEGLSASPASECGISRRSNVG